MALIYRGGERTIIQAEISSPRAPRARRVREIRNRETRVFSRRFCCLSELIAELIKLPRARSLGLLQRTNDTHRSLPTLLPPSPPPPAAVYHLAVSLLSSVLDTQFNRRYVARTTIKNRWLRLILIGHVARTTWRVAL